MDPNFELKTQDCLTWLPSQKPGSFQLIVLDPPYNVNFQYGKYRDKKFQKQYFHEQLLVLTHCAQLLSEGGSIIYVNYPETAARIWAGVDFLEPVEWITWVYPTHLGGFPFRRASRAILWFSKGKPLINPEVFKGEYRNPEDPRIKARMEKGLRPDLFDWIEMSQVKNSSHEKRNHPCQLPEKLIEPFVLGTTKTGDLVGDCYAGSGTTAICTIRNGRNFAGCDIDPAYVQVAKDAVNALKKPIALLGDRGALGGENCLALRVKGQSDQIFHMAKTDIEKTYQGFLRDMEVRNYSPLTIQKYALCLKKFIGWLGIRGISDLQKVGKVELKAYAETVTDMTGISISYVCANIRSVKLFFRYLKKTGMILFDISVILKEPKQPKTLPKEALTKQEVKTMLEAPDMRTPLGIRDRAILETFYSTGIRLQEMVNLTPADLDLEDGFLFVREGKGKKDRTVPLGEHASHFIKTYLEASRGLLVAKGKNLDLIKTDRLWISSRGKPLGKSEIGWMVRHYRKKAGIEKEVTPHAFRRTVAVELIRNDCDFLAVKEMLGHSKSETTMRYCALSGVDLKEAHKKSHPREADEPEDVAPKIWSVV